MQFRNRLEIREYYELKRGESLTQGIFHCLDIDNPWCFNNQDAYEAAAARDACAIQDDPTSTQAITNPKSAKLPHKNFFI